MKWIIMISFGVLLCAAAQPMQNEYKLRGFAQGTTWHITYYSSREMISQAQIDSLLASLDSALSIYKPHSIISLFNQSDSGVKINAHLLNVVQRSMEIADDTKGIFDITIYPLLKAWGFGPSPDIREPDSTKVNQLMQCVGSKNLVIEDNWLFKKYPCVQIDINGIAQGYSVDVLAAFVESKGVANYLVEIGGEVKIKGRKPDNSLMKIGIEGPADNESDSAGITQTIALESGAVTTSGSFRNYVKRGGKRLSHLIDARTGYPITNELISVTVYAPDAITADGYDNAIMAMGLPEGIAFVKKHKNIEAYFIYRNPDGVLKDTATNGFYKMLVR